MTSLNGPERISPIPLLKFSRSLSSLVFCLLALLPCPAPAQLLVAAASDLARLQAPLARAYHEFSGQTIRLVLGSSGNLSRQIEQGAPYDVFLSANEQFVKDLAAAGKVSAASVRPYARGRLALWSRDGSVRSLQDLTRPGLRHLALANPKHAPYGLIAKQALENQGLWEALESRIVYAESVRQALQFAESGNAEAALLAWSLVFDRKAILLPESWHSPLLQACGIVAGSSRPRDAARFLEFLTSERGLALLLSYGLFPP